MKAILLVVLFSLSLALAQSGLPIASWAGSTLGVNNAYYPPNSVNTGCSIYTSNSSWVSFNFTFSTTGVRHVFGLGSTFDLYLYQSSFNAFNSCQNALFEFDVETYQPYYLPVIYDYYNFQANITYVFVAATSGSGGDLAVAIYDNVATGTNVGSGLMDSFTIDQNGACTIASSNVPYGKFSWVQPTTGLFDVMSGWAENFTNSIDYSTIMLFSGNVTNAALVASNAPCTDFAANNINAWQESYRGATLWGVQLTAGQSYTIVSATSAAAELSNYGFFIIPSRVRPATYLAQGFVQPYIVDPCSASTSYNNQSYTAQSFPAVYYKVVFMMTYFYQHQNSNWTVMSDYNGYVYTGNNLGSSTAAPSTCSGLIQEYSSNVGSFDTAQGQNYTIVVAYDNYPSAGNGNAFLVFALTGAPIGNVNTSIPGTSSSSGATATGGSGLASGTHSTIGNVTTTTTGGNASAVVCSFVLVALLAFFAL